jgi:hypothetical protein
MASNTTVTRRKRARKKRNMGAARKHRGARRSTLTAAELFAGCGEPGKPAPAPAAR